MRNAKSQYTTVTGAAVSPGRVTRKSLDVKKRYKRNKPLPTELQVHPKYLTPTPLNPGCAKAEIPYGNTGVHLSYKLKRYDFLSGELLSNQGKYCLMIEPKIIGYTDDITFALAYQLAAKAHGVWMSVYEKED